MARVLQGLALSCLVALAAAQTRSQSALFGELFGSAAATPAAAAVAAGRAPPSPRVARSGARPATLQFIGIDVHNNHKIIRAPLIVMDVAVEKTAPVVVEMPNVNKENMNFPCARSGAQLPPNCAVGDVRPGESVVVRVVEARDNVTLMPPRYCRFFFEDLLPNATAVAAPAKVLTCMSPDVNAVRFGCTGCSPPTTPTAFATLVRVRLTAPIAPGRLTLACTAPSSGPFLLALPRVRDAQVEYACTDTGSSSCRLARIAPGDRISCAVLDATRLNAAGAALLPASACRPATEDLSVRPYDCASQAVRITLGCENC